MARPVNNPRSCAPATLEGSGGGARALGFGSPLWSSGFRPFFVLAAAYALALTTATLARALGGGTLAVPHWHAHEAVFGFAAAVTYGIALTALPSWARVAEVRDAPLAVLVALWLGGRLAFWLSPWLPAVVPALAGASLHAAALAILLPQLLRIGDRRFLAVPAVLLALLAAELAFFGISATAGLQLAIEALLLLYAAAGGLLIPVFTGNRLRAMSRGDLPAPSGAHDVAALGTLLAVAVAALAGAPAALQAAAGAAATGVHLLRLARWRGWRVLDDPLLWTLHAGYAWLVIALALRTLGAAGIAPAAAAWTHAFTVGALGSTMLGLMTRVALRHTGRALRVPPTALAAFAAVQLAAIARVGAMWLPAPEIGLVPATVLWIGAFALYALRFSPMLLSASLPRSSP